jgi:hypothetical protein
MLYEVYTLKMIFSSDLRPVRTGTILVFHCAIVAFAEATQENRHLVDCDAMQSCKWLPRFRRNVLSVSSGYKLQCVTFRD